MYRRPNHLIIAGQCHGDPHIGQASGGQTVGVGDIVIDPITKFLCDHIHGADTYHISIGLLRKLQHTDATDLGASGHRAVCTLAGNIGIKSLAGNFFAHLLYDQHIQLIERQLADTRLSQPQHLLIALNDRLSRYRTDITNAIVSILHRANHKENVTFLNVVGGNGLHHAPHAPVGCCVIGLCAVLLAKTDNQHFTHTALHHILKSRMRFYPGDGDDAVSLIGIAIKIGFCVHSQISHMDCTQFYRFHG